MTIEVGASEALTARAYYSNGVTAAASFTWSSADPSIATVVNGVVTAIGVGMTTVTATAGFLSKTAIVYVESNQLLRQWAMGATSSTEYTPLEWSALQATGAPNVEGCGDDPNAWATLSADGVDWLELTYDQPVYPSEIRIYEVSGVGSIVKVEVRDEGGTYYTVYTARAMDPQDCPRVLSIAITDVTSMVSTVRVSVDQSIRLDWNEIDAVRLIGHR